MNFSFVHVDVTDFKRGSETASHHRGNEQAENEWQDWLK